MVYDNIVNIHLYKGLSEDIAKGLEYLQSLDSSICVGVYEVTPYIKAVVSEYNTMHINENGYESHVDYIDIQYLVSGEEIILCKPTAELLLTKGYNKMNDIAFYCNTVSEPSALKLGKGYFAILYPNDGHEPGICVNNPMKVKKVVIKIKINHD